MCVEMCTSTRRRDVGFIDVDWGREGIIVALDRLSGHIKSTSPGRYRLLFFFYTGCRSRRGAGVEEVFCTGSLFYTGTLFCRDAGLF